MHEVLAASDGRTSKRARRSSSANVRSGFTLLEVMVAIAILGLGLTAIFAAQGGSLRGARHARNVSEATGLMRCKMSEVEYDLVKNGYQPTDQSETGPCCDGADATKMTCAWTVNKPEWPEPNFGELDLNSELDFKKGPSVLGGSGPPGTGLGPGGAALGFLAAGKGSMGKAGDDIGGVADSFVGGAEDVEDGVASLVMSIVYPDLKGAFEAGTRKLTVTVTWQEGGRDYSMNLEQWVTNSKEAGLSANVNGLIQGDDGEEEIPGSSPTGGNGGTKSPGGSSTGKRPTTGRPSGMGGPRP
jgi:general secretion pathway protein I